MLDMTGSELAQELGVSKGALSQWKLPGRGVPHLKCVAIEKLTGGRMRRWRMRPHDWNLMWPELVGAEGAPEVMPTARAA